MSTSGLNGAQKATARAIARHAALLGLNHAPAIHYTQGSQRWQGIAEKRHSEEGHYPNYADCSAFVTWCLWNGLAAKYHQGDVVNWEKWQAGYTGTMLRHGDAIRDLGNVRWGDAVIYGVPGTTGEHTAIVTHTPRDKAGPRTIYVVSHGSEGGPYWLPYNYRSDIMSIRRYI